MKAEMRHGEFRSWLEKNNISKSTANRFMRLGERVEMSQLETFESVSAAFSPSKKEQSEGEKEWKNRVDHARERIWKIQKLGKAIASEGFQVDSAFLENALTLKALNLYRKIESEKLGDMDVWAEEQVREFMGMERSNDRD